jgi:hypothetical protein
VNGSYVYVSSADGKLYAFSASCQAVGGSCSSSWTAVLGSYAFAPAVSGGAAYLVDYASAANGQLGAGTGRLVALPLSCTGAPPCPSLWTFAVDGNDVAVGGNTVYVGDFGHTYAIPANCSPSRCSPRWVAPLSFSGWGQRAAIVGAEAYVGIHAASTSCGNPIGGYCPDGKVYAYPANCAQGGVTCAPDWQGSISQAPVDDPATVANGVVYVTGAGNVIAFAANCGSGGATCPPLATLSVPGIQFFGSAVVVNGWVYAVGSGLSRGNQALYAFHIP